jgi:hypothetical protein
VYQILEFYAETRLPADWNSAQRKRLVAKVIERLGLKDVAFSVVGDAIKRGISGMLRYCIGDTIAKL